MKIVRYPSRLPKPCCVTIGNFDGLHLGHQGVVKRLAARAAELSMPSALLTFYPHPREVLGKQPRVPAVSDIRETSFLLSSLGVDVLYLARFSAEFSKLTATEFVEQVLVQAMSCKHLIAGEDAAFGKGREGSVEWMQEHLPAAGITLDVIPLKEMSEGEKLSSSAIREAVADGQVETAEQLLGHPYSIRGRIRQGRGLGRKAHFPTANIRLKGQVVPKRGVYIGASLLDGKLYPSVANFGVRPTVGGSEERLEVHMLGEEFPDLYGKPLRFFFLSFLRGEQKFDSLDELWNQIGRDVESTRSFFEERPEVLQQLEKDLA